MKKLIVSLAFAVSIAWASSPEEIARGYVNRAPLKAKAFSELPLGRIKARGWLKLQLERQRDGLTGNLDERYVKIVGPRNGWLGGDGDGWERGPYWLDGLVPLGHLLEDEKLLAKARPWIEWSLNNQDPSGYFGPKRFDKEPAQEPGVQKTPREDWWPRMVMLKVLQQHYSATGDARVLELMRRYFRYQLTELKKTPLDHWSFWGNRRGADNLAVVYWLYNLTGEEFLLELGKLIHEQTFPYTDIFLNDDPAPSPDLAHLYPFNTGDRYPFDEKLIRRLSVGQLQSFHCVNLAQGIKAPVVYYQQSADERHVAAVKKAFATIEMFHGQPQGMYGGDEPLHGNQPTQGIEFCSVVELMFSLETMLPIAGDMDFADQLELIAYNALPAQSTEDFKHRQYFQCANQVLVTRAPRNMFEDDNHGRTDLVFGLVSGYPCCTCNMHQGWPKLVQSLWHATPDGGLAALVYAPSEVDWFAGGSRVKIVEETTYPFEETVRFRIEPEKEAAFPLKLRVPEWATEIDLQVNGQKQETMRGQRLLQIACTWKKGDQVTVAFGAQPRTSRWVENSVAVERGPLVYALRIEEDWRFVKNDDQWGEYYEVHPKTPWNYGLLESAVRSNEFKFSRRELGAEYPWTLKTSPLEIRAPAKRIPEWQLYQNQAGPLPRRGISLPNSPAEQIVLAPYGATRLRITEFPVVR